MQLPEKNKLSKIFFIILLFLFFIKIGSFNLNEIPTLHQDEMAFALGAVNLSNIGNDLCEDKFPLFPCEAKEWPYKATTISYYASALFYKFYTPNTIFDIRILSVLIGSLTGIFSLLFFNRLFCNQKNGFIYAAILSVIFYFSPVIFTIQRFGAPYLILSILLQTVLFYLIYEFHKTNKKILLLFIPLTASLLMVEYQLYRFFAPFYFFFFVWLFRRKILKKSSPQKNNLSLLPNIKSILFENKYIFSGIAIFTIVFLIVLQQTITDKFTTEYYFTERNFSLLKLLSDYIFFFSPYPFCFYYNFLHFYNYGFFSFLSIIFFLFGLVWTLKNIKQNNFFKFLLIAFLTYPIPSVLLGVEKFSSNRIINIIPIYFIISAYGLFTFKIFADYFKKRPPNNKILLLLLSPMFWLVIIAGQNFYFIYDYFYKIPYQSNSCQSASEYNQNCGFTGLFYYLKNETANYDKIYLDKDLLFISAYAEFFNKIMNYNIKNYEVADIVEKTAFEKNSIVVISKEKAQAIELEKKYQLIKKISDLSKINSFFYVFTSNK